jgi:hypothetical protein
MGSVAEAHSYFLCSFSILRFRTRTIHTASRSLCGHGLQSSSLASVRRMVSRLVGQGCEAIMLQLENPVHVIERRGNSHRIDGLDAR